MFSSALWLYEFKFQMVSGYSTLVQFQSGTRKLRDLHYYIYIYIYLYQFYRSEATCKRVLLFNYHQWVHPINDWFHFIVLTAL